MKSKGVYKKVLGLGLVAILFIAYHGYAMTEDTTAWIIPTQYLATASATTQEPSVTQDTGINPWERRFSDSLLQTMEGNYTEVEKNYKDIAVNAEDDTTRARALVCLGELYENYIEQPEKAREAYQEVLQKYNSTPYAETALFDEAVVDFHQRKYADAYSGFSTYAVHYPEGKYKDNAKFMSHEAETMLGITVVKPPTIVVPGGPPKIEGYTVRIAILQKADSVGITCDTAFSLWTMDSEKVRTVEGGNYIRVRLTGDGWKIGESIVTTNKLLITSSSDKPLSVENKAYRGQFQLIKDNGKITVVNIVSLEEYLYSVVPKEAGDEWPMEALKAQTVAARTYAMSRKAVRLEHEFDVYDSEIDQVYGGYVCERGRTTEAVDDTKGEILTYDGEPILSYFNSNSGGYTEDALYAFSLRRPYLIAISDPYSKNVQDYRWTLRITAAELQKRMKAKGMNVGTIQNFIVTERSPSGRAMKIRVVHSKGVLAMNAGDFRWKVASTMLRSTLFTVKKEGESFLFSGKGYGHGVGMSQWGCYNMGRKGKTYKEILSFYYPGTKLSTL